MSLILAPQLSQQDNDQALIERACSGNQVAFEMLVNRYQHCLYLFVSKRLDSEEAHDVMQFVWLQCYLSLPTLQKMQELTQDHHLSLKPWLFRVALNRCADELRKQRRRPRTFSLAHLTSREEDENPIFAALLDPTPLPEILVEQHDQRDLLCAAIQTLQIKFRQVVWLRYTEDLTFPEIGERLHLPTNTVKTYFYRACKKLQATISTQRRSWAKRSITQTSLRRWL